VRSWVIRVTSVFLLAFQAFFLNIVVPGHTRGVITLTGRSDAGGAGAASMSGSSCCHTEARKAPEDSSRKAPTPKDRAECAVCHIAARVTTATTIDLRLTELGLLEVLPLPPPQLADSVDQIPTYLGRAPPAV
jgi:hypothetical protein